MIRSYEIYHLLKNDITLVGGENGMERKVSWPYIATSITPIEDYIDGGEFIFINIYKNIKDVEEHMINIIRAANIKLPAGICLSMEDDFIEIPQGVIDIANQVACPLFCIPWKVRFVEINSRVCNYISAMQNFENNNKDILYETVFSKVHQREYIIQRFYELGLDAAGNFRVGLIQVNDCMRRDEYSDYVFRIKSVLDNIGKEIVCADFGNQMMFLIEEKKKDKFLELLNKCIEKIEMDNRAKTPIVVVLGTSNRLFEVHKSFEAAQKLLQMKEAMGEKTILTYEEVGIFQFVCSMKEEEKKDLEEYCTRRLKKLVEYDKCNNTEFLKTLKIYVENQFNIARTATALYIHRNTLIYRMRKIEEILGITFEDTYEIIDLINCIMVKQII